MVVEQRLELSPKKLEKVKRNAIWKCAEDCVKAHFEEQKEATVIRISNLKYKKTSQQLQEALKKNSHYPSKKGNIRKFHKYIYNNFNKKGMPDFVVIKQYTIYFLEVKSNFGRLREYQLRKIKEIERELSLTTYLVTIKIDLDLKHEDNFIITKIYDNNIDELNRRLRTSKLK